MLDELNYVGESQDYGDVGRPHRGPQPKPGDWYCPSCGDLQFSRNIACRKCGTPNSDSGYGFASAKHAPGDAGQKPMRAGDWMCPACNDHNYARNAACRKCGEPCPAGCGHQQLPGDWTCPQCGDYQFAKNQACRRCQTPNPNPNTDPQQQGLAHTRPSDSRLEGAGTLRGPELQQRPGDWYCPSCGEHQFASRSACRRCFTPCPTPSAHTGPVQKPGDWYCPSCNDLQFARNTHCKTCGTANPSPTSPAGTSFQMRPGDWLCPICGDLQFATRSQCRKCGTGPDGMQGDLSEEGYSNGSSGFHKPTKPGDWICPACGDLQFASRSTCRKCGAAPGMQPQPMATMQGYAHSFSGGKGGKQMRPGDWSCPSCGDHNFAKNTLCRRCGTPSPDPPHWGSDVAMRMMADSQKGKAGAKGSKDHTGAPERPTSWKCPNCNELVFARNSECKSCGTPRPENAESGCVRSAPY